MPTFQALAVVAVLIGGLALGMNLSAGETASETPMLVNTPAATI